MAATVSARMTYYEASRLKPNDEVECKGIRYVVRRKMHENGTIRLRRKGRTRLGYYFPSVPRKFSDIDWPHAKTGSGDYGSCIYFVTWIPTL